MRRAIVSEGTLHTTDLLEESDFRVKLGMHNNIKGVLAVAAVFCAAGTFGEEKSINPIIDDHVAVERVEGASVDDAVDDIYEEHGFVPPSIELL